MRSVFLCVAALLTVSRGSPSLRSKTSSLPPYAWAPLPTGAIRAEPSSWLQSELEVQADGMAGTLDSYWAPLGDSIWLGGSSTFQDWVEIFPYVFDGMTALGNGWQGVRWQDWVHVNMMLMDRADTSPADQAMLQALNTEIRAQSLAAGVDWERGWYVDGKFPTEAVPGNQCNMFNHGVNTAQALKSGAVLGRMSPPDAALGRESTYKRLQLLDDFHGVPSGLFQADEHLAGLIPSHSTETCTIVETVFSLNVDHEILGDASFADRAERILLNALPAALDERMTSRVYLHASNQIAAVDQSPHVWISDGSDAEMYGLVTNYACCTANYHQGWPKAVSRSVHVAPDGGLALSLLLPVTAVWGGVTLVVNTSYPFGDTVTITLRGLSSSQPTPFHLRIPDWATAATLSINGGGAASVGASNGTMLSVSLPATPAGTATLVLDTAPAIVVSGPWFGQSVAVHRGAVLYTLKLDEVWTVLHTYAANHSYDFNVTLGANSPWGLALVLDPTDPASALTFSGGGPIPYPPFSSTGVPMQITGKARQVFGWGTQFGQPAGPPPSPIDCTPAGVCGPVFDVVLVPFGTSHLRMTELPWTAA